MNEVKFGMKVVQYSKSSFERQIMESVIIQNERKEHYLLNSRTEYNRCSLPRLCTQVGDGEYVRIGKELEQERVEEDKLEYKIRQMRKNRNKARLHPTKQGGPSTRRRKIDSNEYIRIEDIWGAPPVTVAIKNKIELEENENKKRRKVEVWKSKDEQVPPLSQDGNPKWWVGRGSPGDPCILSKKATSVVTEGGPPMGYTGGVIGVGSDPTPSPPKAPHIQKGEKQDPPVRLPCQEVENQAEKGGKYEGGSPKTSKPPELKQQRVTKFIQVTPNVQQSPRKQDQTTRNKKGNKQETENNYK